MDHSFSSGSFYEDEVIDEGNDDLIEEAESVGEESESEDLLLGLSEEERQKQLEQLLLAKEQQQLKLKESSSPTTTNATNTNNNTLEIFCFVSESTVAGAPRAQTLTMLRREQDWFLVVIRDLLCLVEQFRFPDNPSTNGSFAVVDGNRFADNDALQIRLKRNCSVLSSAMKAGEGDQHFSPKAVELATSALMPFVLSEPFMFGCRSTWNVVIMCLKNIMRRMKNPPKTAFLVAAASPEEGSAAAQAASSQATNLPLDRESGIALEWRPVFALCQKVVGASVIPGQTQAYDLLFSLIMAMNRCISSSSLNEIWSFTRRHFIGHISAAFAARIIPSRVLGRQNGVVDTESIKQQCATLTEMLDWISASWKVPHPITNTEEIFQALAFNIMSPVGVRLFEKNRQAFDGYVVPLRKRVIELLQPHLRVNLGARKQASSGGITTTSENGVKLMSMLIVRGHDLGWDELIRWRRVLEPFCATKSTNSVPIRYISDVITGIAKETQKRLNILRAKRPVPARETLLEVFPALEGQDLQRFLSLTVPLVANLAFNPKMFSNYSYAMWVLSFLDPTPATAARALASVQVGMSDAGKETKQVTQALKILSDVLCALSAQTLYTVASSNDEKINSLGGPGRQWSELLEGIDIKNLPTHTTPGALQNAAKELLSSSSTPSSITSSSSSSGAGVIIVQSPIDCVKKTTIEFFYKALENLESTVEDRVNDAFRCIYALTIFGQADTLPAARRKELVRAFIDKVEEKYFPVEAYLSATTAGILHYAFTGVFRLISDDLEETLRIIQLVRDMLAKPSIHETWSTCLRTMIAGILEQGSVRLFARSLSTASSSPTTVDAALNNKNNNNNNNNKNFYQNIRQEHADLLPWFDPLIEQIFEAARVELANGLTTTSRFVGNVYVVCTLLEHLPAPVLNQLALEPCKKFVSYCISWCQERAADPEINEKGEADLRCAASSIQSILDVALRGLLKPMPFDVAQITLCGHQGVWQSNRDKIRYIEATVVEQRAARDMVEFYLCEAKNQLASIPEKANSLERAFRCAVVGRILGGCRGGCWAFNSMSGRIMKSLDDEIAITKDSISKNQNNNNNNTSNNNLVEILSTKTPAPSQNNFWWTARYYDIDNFEDDPSLCGLFEGCTPGLKRDLTDVDTEIYLWLIQEMVGQYCFVPASSSSSSSSPAAATISSSSGEDDANSTKTPRENNIKITITKDNNNNNNNNNADEDAEEDSSVPTSPQPPSSPAVPRVKVGYLGKLVLDHPLLQMDSNVEVEDIPNAAYKTVMSFLEGNYSFDYTSLLNEIVAPGDENGRELYHFRMGSARSFIKNRDRAGAFSRPSSDWSSRLEAAIMLNLSFSKSVTMRQQAQAVVVGFVSMWYQMQSQLNVVDEIVQSIKKRLDMGNPGWLVRLSDVHCKAALYLIVELCSVLDRDHIFQLAEPLLTELCLGGKLRRPSNENRKEGTINALIGKLQSTSYGPPAHVCDRQIGRWLDLAMETGRAPISITRCLRVALCYFRHLKRLNEHCSVNAVSRVECLAYITDDHVQFCLSLVTQLHRATEFAWKILHNIGLVISREMHFIHTHLPREGVHECECCPVVSYYNSNRGNLESDKDPWIPLKGPNHAITDCCPFLSNYLQPTASCAILHRKAYTYGKVSGHTAELATTLGHAFLRPEFIRQCLDVHVALLRSEAIAGERSGRRSAAQKVQSSPLANAIEWSRFGRCALWAQLSKAYEKFGTSSSSYSSSSNTDSASSSSSSPSICELEIKALHNLTAIWSKAIDGILPRFDSTGAMRSPQTLSPQATPRLLGITPAMVATNIQSHIPEMDQLDAGAAIQVQQQEQQQHEKTEKQVESQDAAEPFKRTNTVQFDENPEQQQQQQKHKDPEKDQEAAALLAQKQKEEEEAAAAAASAAAAAAAAQKQQQQQTSVICEYLAGNALTRGLFPALQHLAYPIDAPNNKTVVETRRAIIDLILDLFRETMFVPSVPHEAAALFLNSWGGFAGALSTDEKIVVHKYLFSIVTMSTGNSSDSNELVRRRAWHALRKSYGNPARGFWREALLLEDAFLMDQLLTKEIYDTAISDPSRSVRAEANATFRGLLESSVVARIASFYDHTDQKGSGGSFPVDPEILRSDQLSQNIEETLLKLRLETLQQDPNHQNRVRAALSLISLVTAGVALQSVIPQIPNIATTLISVPSEAASAAQLIQLRRAPSDYKSVAEILIGLLISLQSEVTVLSKIAGVETPSPGASPAIAQADSSDNSHIFTLAAAAGEAAAAGASGQDSAASGRVALIMARVSPLIIYLRYLANSRFACDIALPGNLLDIVASAFALPGRQLLVRVSQTLSTWATVLPRADVRDFIVRTIKSLDAASKVKDTLTMKIGVASLSSVVNSFPQTIPAFIPACLMKLVKYKTAVTLTRDEMEEQKLKEREEKGLTETTTANEDDANDDENNNTGSTFGSGLTKTEDYKSIATEGLQAWWASHLEAWDQEHKANFTEAQAQAIGDACKARSYFV